MANHQDYLNMIRVQLDNLDNKNSLNKDLVRTSYIELANACEGLKQSAQQEIERYVGVIGELKGRMKAAELMQAQIVVLLTKLNEAQEKADNERIE